MANIVADCADKESGRAAVEHQLKQELADAKAQAKQLEPGIHAETKAHAATRQAQRAETIARHTAEQQISGLKERLAENEALRLLQEDKHNHARQALEHYRQAAKEHGNRNNSGMSTKSNSIASIGESGGNVV